MKAQIYLPMAALAVAAWTAHARPDVEPVTPLELGPPVDTEQLAEDALRRTSRNLQDRDLDVPLQPLLFEHTRLAGYKTFMESFGPTRQRVKIRSVEAAYGNHAPVFYPALHWIPADVLEHELTQPGARYTEAEFQAGARDAGRDNYQAFALTSMLNVRLFPRNDGLVCCSPEAVLVVELAVDELDPRRIRFDMTETDPGVYYVDDPHDAAASIVSEVISFGERPLMTVVALEGSHYRASHPTEGISYVVRWGTLDLEYGSHIAGDPKAVIR